MSKITRFGVSLPKELVDRFDRLTSQMGYFNRSKAIKDAITDFISQKEWSQKTKETKKNKFIGTLSFTYGHETRGVTHKLTEVQHDHGNCIISVMHAHITHKDCIEVLILNGSASEIKELSDKISATRGVNNSKLDVLLQR